MKIAENIKYKYDNMIFNNVCDVTDYILDGCYYDFEDDFHDVLKDNNGYHGDIYDYTYAEIDGDSTTSLYWEVYDYYILHDIYDWITDLIVEYTTREHIIKNEFGFFVDLEGLF
jgi:hypothetical protein